MSNGTEIFISRFKSPPRERVPTPSASAPSDGGSFSSESEIYISRFKSPPRGRGPTPSASAPSDGRSFFSESDPPHGVDASFTFPGFDSQRGVPIISPSVGGGSHPSEDSENIPLSNKKDSKKGSKRTNEEMGKDEEAEDISWSKRPKVKAGRRVKLMVNGIIKKEHIERRYK